MNSAALVALLLGVLDRATQIGQLIDKSRAEGRDVSAAELEALHEADAAERQKLVDAIAAAKAEGR